MTKAPIIIILIVNIFAVGFLFVGINIAEAACDWTHKGFAPFEKTCAQLNLADGTTCLGVQPANKICCCAADENKSSAGANTGPEWKIPDVQIKIPGLAFSQSIECDDVDEKTGKGTNCKVPWIWEYIVAIYKYAVGIIGIIAVVVMMFGGFVWITAGGNTARIGEAKNWIGASVTGLIIVLCSYSILYYINPKLTESQYLIIGDIEKVSGDTNQPLDSNYSSNVGKASLPTSGTVAAVVAGSIGKVTYGLNSNIKAGDCSGKGGAGPDNTICFDCSGFAKYVVKTALGKDIPDGTSNIFSGQNKLNKDNINSLPAGTLIGWAPGDNGKSSGHVMIALGDGKFADSHGGDSGRKAGNAIGVYTSDQIKAKYGDTLKVRYIN